MTMRLYILLICCLLFSPYNNLAHAQDPTSYQELRRLGRGTIHALDWNTAGSILAVGGTEDVWFYDDQLAVLTQHGIDNEYITALRWNHDSTQLAIGTQAGNVQIWQVVVGNNTIEITLADSFSGSTAPINTIEWSPEDTKLAILTTQEIIIWDIGQQSPMNTYHGGLSFAWGPTDDQFALTYY